MSASASGQVSLLSPTGRENPTGRVYGALRAALMEGRMQAGQRLKIRNLAQQLAFPRRRCGRR